MLRPTLAFRWKPVLRKRWYWINRRTREVHFDGCPVFPEVNEVCFGRFAFLCEAVGVAEVAFPGADPCDFCFDRELRMEDAGRLGWRWVRLPVLLPPH